MDGFMKMFNKNGLKNHNVSNTAVQTPQVLTKDEMIAKEFKRIDATKRVAVDEWRKAQTPVTPHEEFYLNILERASKRITCDYNIAVLEPSVKEGNIFYHEDEVVATGYSLGDWDRMAKDFMPERNSRLATLDHLFVFYGLRNVENLWSIQDVCDYSNRFGNYWDAPKSKRHIEHSGVRKAAGYFDGIGNTSKICRYDEFVFAVTGGHFDKNGTEYPVGGYIKYSSDASKVFRFSTGVVVCD